MTTIKTSSIHARIKPLLKHKVEAILEKLGMTTSEAINLYFSQIALHNGLPFDVKVPNKTTTKAMQDMMLGNGTKTYKTVADLRKDLES